MRLWGNSLGWRKKMRSISPWSCLGEGLNKPWPWPDLSGAGHWFPAHRIPGPSLHTQDHGKLSIFCLEFLHLLKNFSLWILGWGCWCQPRKMVGKVVWMLGLLHALAFFSKDKGIKQFQYHSLMPEIRYGHSSIGMPGISSEILF